MRSLVTTALAAALTLGASVAHAEPTPAERVAARTLFDDGRALVKSHDYAHACPKLEESQRLDPGIGTMYNLADCYEGLGRFASAWTIFLDVAEASRRAGEEERARVANGRAAELAPRLPHLRVSVGAAPAPSLTLDQKPFAAALVDTPVPVDPGVHTLGADAPGKKHWGHELDAAPGATITVSVPQLEDLPSDPRPLLAPVVHSPVASARWQAPVAIVAVSLGVIGLGVGSAFGAEAVSDWSAAKPGCPGNHCTAGAYSAWESAHAAGIASSAAFIAGGVLVATGAAVWFTRPRGAVRVGLRPDGVMLAAGSFR